MVCSSGSSEGKRAGAGLAVRGKCMLAVAKGRKSESTMVERREKPVSEASAAVMRHRCSPWNHIPQPGRRTGRLESRQRHCRATRQKPQRNISL